MIYIDVTPIIPNTTMQKAINEKTGREMAYKITVNEGYVIHDKGRDYNENVLDENGNYVLDENGNPVTVFKQGFTTGSTTCGLNYDFTPFELERDNGETVTAYGTVREYFTIPANNVPADQIFGVGNNDHEIM